MTAKPVAITRYVIHGMRGLGDVIYHRPFVRAMVRDKEVWLRTAWPEIFDDIPGLRLIRDITRLRTQSKNIARNGRRLYQSDPARQPGSRVIQARYGISAPYRGIIPDLAEVFGVPFEPDLFDLPLGGPSPVSTDRPIALVRPVTVRREWANPARNCKPEYIADAITALSEAGYHVVSVADVLPNQEWFEGTPPVAETVLHRGELIFPRLMDLLRNAAVVVGPVGWIAPAAAAAKRPLILIGGGQGAWNNPDVIYSPDVDTSRVQWILPDNYCLCCHVDHACEKTITDFGTKFREALGRAAEQWHEPTPTVEVPEPLPPIVARTSRRADWNAERGRYKVESLSRGDRGVSILVPRGAGDGSERAMAWAWVRRRYATLFPDWEIVVGYSNPAAWRKGEAVNDALSRAHGAILVIADSDCVVPAEGLKEAVAAVLAGAPWAIPHRKVHRLNPDQTRAWLAGPVEDEREAPIADLARPAYNGVAGGGILVVPRSDYLATGGIPAQFCGWGGEDEALAVILDTMLGPHRRLEYPLVHLWHEPAPNRAAEHQMNRPIFQAIKRYAGRPDEMLALVRPETAGQPTTIQEARMTNPGGVGRAFREAQEARAAERARKREEAVARRAAARSQANAESAQRAAAFAAAEQARRAAKMGRGPIVNKMLPGPVENKIELEVADEFQEAVGQ